MTSNRELRYHNRYEKLLDKNHKKLSAISGGFESPIVKIGLEKRLTDELWKQAKFEVDKEAEQEIGAVLEELWSSKLTHHVEAILDGMDKRVELAAAKKAELDTIESKYEKLMPKPWLLTDHYNLQRVKLLRKKLSAAGLKLCSGCLAGKIDVHLALIVGQRIHSEDKCNSYSEGVARYQRLQYLCSDCRLESVIAPQQRRVYGDSPTVVFCNVWPAEKRGKEYWAQISGKWNIVPDGTSAPLDPLRDRAITDKLAKKWDLPPELHYYSQTNQLAIKASRDRAGAFVTKPDSTKE